MELPRRRRPSLSTISPSSNDMVLAAGTEHPEEVITVTIPPSTGVNKADVYLLADTTGSMGSIVGALKAGANRIIGSPFTGVDIAFGVGNYKDLPKTNPPFINQTAPTTNKSEAISQIQQWHVEGGGDRAEAQLFALNALAESPEGPAIGWRKDSKRIIVWFGDQPGHDPICKAMSGLDEDITEASVRARLTEEDITVIAISTNGRGLDADPSRISQDYARVCAIGGSEGQATRIASETGGTHVTGIRPDQIVDTIIELVEAAVQDVGEVKLVPSPAIAPFVEAISPVSFKDLAGDEEHVLHFTVKCRGALPCETEDKIMIGAMDAIADGANIASQSVQITVPACNPLRLTRFVLVDAETNEDIRVLAENDILDMSTLPSALNVRVEAGDAVQSVRFALAPEHAQLQVEENLRPYSLFGDIGDDYNHGSFANGNHTITAVPFSEFRAEGEQGAPLSVSIQVINGMNPA